jgi:hypothetical protein
VSIDRFNFGPMAPTVSAGTQLVWLISWRRAQIATSADHKFKSHALDTGETVITGIGPWLALGQFVLHREY